MPTFARLLSRFTARPRRRGFAAPAPAAESLEDRILLTTQGRPDVELIGRAADGWWWSNSYENSTNANRQAPFGRWTPSLTWTEARTGDFDGDGLQDVIGRIASTGDWWVTYADPVETSPGFRSTNVFAGKWSTGTMWSDIAAVDLAADGDRGVRGHFIHKADLVGRAGDGTWFALIPNTNGTFRTASFTRWNPNAGWQDVRFIDINDDGATDILGRDKTGLWWATVSIVGSDQEGLTYKTNAIAQWNPNGGWHDVRVVNETFFGDGSDSLLARDSSGLWWALKIDGTPNATPTTTKFVGAWNEKAGWHDVLIADLDGNDRDEIVARASNGQWWAGAWVNGALQTSYLGLWNENAGWRDVQIVENIPNQSDAIAGRTSIGDWFLADVPNGQLNSLFSRFVGHWNEAAGWKDVRFARVTRQEVDSTFSVNNDSTTESRHIHIYAYRGGAQVSVQGRITANKPPGIKISYHAGNYLKDWFIYPSASNLTKAWTLYFFGHYGDDSFENHSSTGSFADGETGIDFLDGRDNGATDELRGGDGADTVLGNGADYVGNTT